MVSTVTSIEDDVIDIQEAARLLCMSVKWTYRAAARGDVPSFKLGAARRFRRSALRRFLDQRVEMEASR